MEKNADEWTGSVEISKEGVPGSKRSMHCNNYTDLLQALKGEPLSFVFSSDGTLISASAAPHCGEWLPDQCKDKHEGSFFNDYANIRTMTPMTMV